MYAVFRSAAHRYQGDGSVDDATSFLIDYLKGELAHHLSCPVAELAKQATSISEFILACCEDEDVARPALESHLVFSGTLSINGTANNSGHVLKWSNRSQASRYGGCWIGRAEFISHIVNHKNKALPQISGQYGMMTLADAVDYTRFLIEAVCDYQRFASMVPDCSRPITLATLTPDRYEESTHE